MFFSSICFSLFCCAGQGRAFRYQIQQITHTGQRGCKPFSYPVDVPQIQLLRNACKHIPGVQGQRQIAVTEDKAAQLGSSGRCLQLLYQVTKLRCDLIVHLPAIRRMSGKVLPEGGRGGDVVLLPLLEHVVQGDVQRRVTDDLAANHDATEQCLGSGHPVVVVGAGLFLHRAAQLHIGRGEPQSLVLALVEVRHGTLRKGDRRQPCRLQVRPVDGQRGRLRLRAKGFCQLRAEEAAQEAENARNEAEQEWESFSDGILNSLYDIEATAEDISDDMSEYMRKALIKAMYVENFKPQMQKWYNEWKKAMGDDDLTSEEKQLLDSMKQTMVDDMKKEVDAINQFFGTMFLQQASSKGFEAMSQDTGEELNGRFTALQVAGEEIKNQSIQQTGLLSSINGKLSLLNLRSGDVPALLSGTPNFADRAKETIASGYQSQVHIVFPTEDIKALTDKVSNMERLVDEMRTFQVEGNMDRRDILENSVILAKNSPRILDNTNDIKQDIKNL